MKAHHGPGQVVRQLREGAMEEIECMECGWQGYISELLCSNDDFDKKGPVDFNICPDCGEKDCFEDIENDENE